MDDREAELQRRQALSAAGKLREVEARAAKAGRSSEIADELTALRVKVEQLARDVEQRQPPRG